MLADRSFTISSHNGNHTHNNHYLLSLTIMRFIIRSVIGAKVPLSTLGDRGFNGGGHLQNREDVSRRIIAGRKGKELNEN